MNLSEHDIEEQILYYLNFKRRISAWKNPTGGYFDSRKGIFRKQVSKFARNGISDIIGLAPGRGLFIEVKAEKAYRYLMKHYEELKNYRGTCSKKNHLKEQILFIEEAQASGNVAFFADSVSCVEKELLERGVC